MPKNYYDELLISVKQMIKNNQNDQAVKLIEEEFKLPYIPSIYEEKLKKIYEEIKPNFQNKKQTNPFTKEEIIEIFLNFTDEHSSDFLMEIAQMMFEYNWRDHIDEIQQIFSHSRIKNGVKATIYNVLSLQNLNHNFLIGDFNLNPLIDKTLFETDFAIRNFNEIENSDVKNPTLIDVSKKILMIYLMNQFPESMNLKLKILTNDFIEVANVMLGQKKVNELSSQQNSIYKIIKLN